MVDLKKLNLMFNAIEDLSLAIKIASTYIFRFQGQSNFL